MTRVRATAAAAAVLILASACTPAADPAPAATQPPASPPAWTEPASYSFVLERRCDGKESMGVYRVRVTGGEVAEATRIDGKQASGVGEEEIEILPLGGLLDAARTAHEDGGSMATSADPTDGHPALIAFDVSENGDNADNTCFRISEYAAG